MTTTLTIPSAAEAAGVEARLAQAWLERGVIALGDGDIPSPGQGHPARLGLQRTLQIAICGELVKSGTMAGRAAKIAARFADHQGGVAIDQSRLVRPAATLYPDGGTYIVVAPNRPPEVVGAPANASYAEVARAAYWADPPPGTIVVLIDPIFHRTAAAFAARSH